MSVPGHLTPELCGDLAAATAPKHLALTHFYPPVERVDIRADRRQPVCRSDHPGVRRVVLRDRGRVMLVVMQNHATQAEIERVVEAIEEMGYAARPMPGETRTTVGLVGNDGRVDGSRIEALPGVAEIIHVSKPYKQVSREWKSGEHHRHDRARRVVRRVRDRGHRRSVLGGIRGADHRRRAGRARRRRDGAAWRRVQAAQLAVLVSGSRQTRPRAARHRAPRNRACPSSPKRSTKKAPTSLPSMPTASRSARATCRTIPCFAPSERSASRCCSSAAWRRRLRICS